MNFYSVIILMAVVLISCSHVDIEQYELNLPETLDTPLISISPLIPLIDVDLDSTMITRANVTSLMLEKSKELKNAFMASEGLISSIYLYNSTVNKFLDSPQRLAARIAMLGFTDIYLSMPRPLVSNTNKVMYEWVKAFNEEVHMYNIRVHVIAFSNLSMYLDNSKILTQISIVVNYNSSVTYDQQFDYVSADLEPHTIREGDSTLPEGMKIFWTNDNFVIGGSNDLLLKRTLEMINIAKNNSPIPLSNETVIPAYQDNTNQGLLKYGNSSDFLKYCKYVSVMAYYNTKEKILKNGLIVLNSVNQKSPKSVQILIKTNYNKNSGSTELDTLYYKGWDYVIETVNFINQSTLHISSMVGVGVFEYSSLEVLWEAASIEV